MRNSATDSHGRRCEIKLVDGFNEVLALTVPSAELMANSNVERHGPSKLVVEKRSRIVQNDVLLCCFTLFSSLRHSNQARFSANCDI